MLSIFKAHAWVKQIREETLLISDCMIAKIDVKCNNGLLKLLFVVADLQTNRDGFISQPATKRVHVISGCGKQAVSLVHTHSQASA